MFVEVDSNLSQAVRWRNLKVNTGASHGTLQDIKLPEYVGGTSYYVGGVCRTLFWRVCHDTLELFEHSLHVQLSHNRLRLQLVDSPILQGLSVTPVPCGDEDNDGNVTSLVLAWATTASVHRLCLATSRCAVADVRAEAVSVLRQVTAAHITHPDNIHLLPNNDSDAAVAVSAGSGVLSDGRVVFVLCCAGGGGLCVQLMSAGDSHDGCVLATCLPLQGDSMLGRLLGLMASTSTSAASGEKLEAAVVVGGGGGGGGVSEAVVAALCADCHVRVWCLTDAGRRQRRTHAQLLSWDLLRAAVVPAGVAGQTRHLLAARLCEVRVDHRQRHGRHSQNQPAAPVLCAYVALSSCRLFVVLRLRDGLASASTAVASGGGGGGGGGGSWSCEHVTTVVAPEHSLVDFSVSSDSIWAVWTTTEGETEVSHHRLHGLSSDHSSPPAQFGYASVDAPDGWVPVEQFAAPPAVVHVHPSEHVSHAYLRAILQPGRFNPETINRALSLFSGRAADHTASTDSSALSRAIIEAVTDRVTKLTSSVPSSVPSSVTGDSEAELSRTEIQCWQMFYSSCLQYHQVCCKCVGVWCAGRDDGQVCLLRHSFVTHVRRCDWLEQMWSTTAPSSGDNSQHLQSCVCAVVRCCRRLDRAMSRLMPNYELGVWTQLLHGLCPSSVAQQLCESAERQRLSPAGAQLFDELQLLTDRCGDQLVPALNCLLSRLQLIEDDEISPAVPQDVDMMDDDHDMMDASFGSRSGCQLISGSVRQQALLRLRLCRSLLVLMRLLVSTFGRAVGAQQTADLGDVLLPLTVILTQAYVSVVWLTDTVADAPSMKQRQLCMRQMSALAVNGAEPAADAVALDSPRSLLQMLVSGIVGRAACASTCTAGSFNTSLLRVCAGVLRLLWPINGGGGGGEQCFLPEALYASMQHRHLCRYVRQLSVWCDAGSSSRQLLHALSLLCLGRPDKACDVFVAASDGVGRDEPLITRLMQLDALTDGENAPAPAAMTVEQDGMSLLLGAYFLKVIQLLERHGHADWIVSMAETAIECVGDGAALTGAAVRQHTTLCCVMFKYQLHLDRVEDAYDTLMRLASSEVRGDCLRQLITCLLQRRQWRRLTRLPLSSAAAAVFDDTAAIVMEAARGGHPHCYRLLYALHVRRADYRRAGRVIYEMAAHLAAAATGTSSDAQASGSTTLLRQRWQCLQMAVNALQLVSAGAAWTVVPLRRLTYVNRRHTSHRRIPATRQMDVYDDDDYDDEAEQETLAVVTLDDIRDEALCVHARYVLAELDAVTTDETVGAEELVALLASAGRLIHAVKLARRLEISESPAVQQLTRWLVGCNHNHANHPNPDNQQDRDEKRQEEEQRLWQLLADNRPDQLVGQSEQDSSNIGTRHGGDGCVRQQLWQLLRLMIDTAPSDSQQLQLLRAAAQQLLQLNQRLPDWLSGSYESHDAAGLCRLLLKVGRLEEAGWLMVRVLDAHLGQCPPYKTVTDGRLRLCFPYTQLDQVLDELARCNGLHHYDTVKEAISHKLDVYVKAVTSMSAAAVAAR